MRRLYLPLLCLCLSACVEPRTDQAVTERVSTSLSEAASAETLSEIIQKRAEVLNITAHALTYQFGNEPTVSIYTGEGVDENSLFQAASLSKAVAAYGILALAEEKNIGLEQDIRPLITSLDFSAIPGGDKPLTLKALLSHTAGASQSGFPGYPKKWRETGTLPNSVEVVTNPPHRFLKPIRLDGDRGVFHYSGGGYQMAQIFAEDVSGEPFSDLMKTYVFTPLNMTRSTFSQPIDPTAIAPLKIATARSDLRIKEGVFKGFETGWYDYPEQAAAGLWTTSADYMRFASTLLEAAENQDSPMSASIAKTMLTAVDEGYGLGVMLESQDTTSASFWHSGANTGYRTLFHAQANPHLTVVSFSNAPLGHALNEEIVSGVRAHASSAAKSDP